ncbi:MAG TPA: alcohol dehydrogenase catalytic domain-containing protein [Nocardioidaceae bacterium]|nr:alcohol dehydrogenase catalytic domain-containing protein [Nocardioidaceae bacterium]
MRALVYEGPEVMTLRDLPTPAVGPDDVLVRVAYAGICGSELSGFLGTNSLRRPPLVFGHELSGWVEAVGERVREDGSVRPGDQVSVNPLTGCGRCEYCDTARPHLCGRRRLLGAHLPGCNADYVSVPASSVLPLPGSMPLQRSALAEPAACAMHAVELSGAGPTMSALVVGAGPIGLFILQVLAEHGVARRYVADLNPTRLARAAATGAIPLDSDCDGDGVPAQLRAQTGRGVDLAFDAVGAEQTRTDCLAATVPGGRIVLVGLHADETTLPVNTVVRGEVSLTGAFAYTHANFRDALSWLAEERIGFADGVVVAPLEDGPQWYSRLVAGHGAAKVLLTPGTPARGGP